jgi:hypothetical protein
MAALVGRKSATLPRYVTHRPVLTSPLPLDRVTPFRGFPTGNGVTVSQRNRGMRGRVS